MARPLRERLRAKRIIKEIVLNSNHRPITIDVLIRSVDGVSPSTVRRAIHELVSDGYVRQISLPPTQGRPPLAYLPTSK